MLLILGFGVGGEGEAELRHGTEGQRGGSGDVREVVARQELVVGEVEPT